MNNRIAAFREKVGLTQEELAAKVGMSPYAISNIERGTRAPRIHEAQRIAEALGRTTDEVFPRERKKAAAR